MNKNVLLLASAVLSLAAAPFAQANTISGTVYINQAPYTGAPLGPPVGSPSGTFTVNGINFNTNTGYSIGSFLASGGNTVSGLSPSVANNALNNSIFEFTGTTYLTAGTVYTVTHDDGVYLYLNGSSNVLGPGNSGIPTVAEDSYFSVASSGNYSFYLEYTDVNGPPGVLNAPFAAVAATPEPSSLVLLGTGVLGAVGAVRRRFKA